MKTQNAMQSPRPTPPTRSLRWDVELTDTFGGEANYSWVRRWTIDAFETVSDRAIARRAKALADMSGVRGQAYWHGDSYEFRPFGCCVVLFVTLRDC